jgi:anti-sigma B factor antagonist
MAHWAQDWGSEQSLRHQENVLMVEGIAVELVHRDGTGVLMVRGDIDMDSAEFFSSAMERAVSLGVPVAVDLSGVTFIDSSGLHALVRARTSAPRACPFVVRNPPAQVRRLFTITCLDYLLGDEADPIGAEHERDVNGSHRPSTTNR